MDHAGLGGLRATTRLVAICGSASPCPSQLWRAQRELVTFLARVLSMRRHAQSIACPAPAATRGEKGNMTSIIAGHIASLPQSPAGGQYIVDVYPLLRHCPSQEYTAQLRYQ